MRGDDSPYGLLTNTARLAAQGPRYLLPELRDETPPAKEGGPVRVSYPDARGRAALLAMVRACELERAARGVPFAA